MIRALIFDFDGMILDTETPQFLAWQDVYREHGQELTAGTWGQIVGGTAASTFEPAGHLQDLVGRSRQLDLEAIQSVKRARVFELIAARPILPGILDTLEAARRLGLRLAIASSSSHKWVDTHLTTRGLSPFFEPVVCSEDVTRVKPYPDVYLQALEVLRLPADQAVAFEDSPNGVRAACRAGLPVVAVPNPMTAQLSIEGETLRLNSLAELPLEELLRRFDVQI
jgi:HAD superfamily hydrolase (TIGR01509 family)